MGTKLCHSAYVGQTYQRYRTVKNGILVVFLRCPIFSDRLHAHVTHTHCGTPTHTWESPTNTLHCTDCHPCLVPMLFMPSYTSYKWKIFSFIAVLHGVYKNASTSHIDMPDFRGVFGSANNATCILCRGFCTSYSLYILQITHLSWCNCYIFCSSTAIASPRFIGCLLSGH